MTQREEKILNCIVEEYIKTAQPVASHNLVKKYCLKVSPATVRNEMMVLEENGFISQPHTSAGRIPTEKGFKYFVENYVRPQLAEPEVLAKQRGFKQEKALLKSIVKRQLVINEALIKNLAKKMAELVDNTIIVGFSPNNLYYTGLSYMFSQPEFQEYNFIYNIAQVIDRLDRVINKLYNELADDLHIYLGTSSLINEHCALIATKLTVTEPDYLFGILGPLRMDYLTNSLRLKLLKEVLSANQIYD